MYNQICVHSSLAQSQHYVCAYPVRVHVLWVDLIILGKSIRNILYEEYMYTINPHVESD